MRRFFEVRRTEGGRIPGMWAKVSMQRNCVEPLRRGRISGEDVQSPVCSADFKQLHILHFKQPAG